MQNPVRRPTLRRVASWGTIAMTAVVGAGFLATGASPAPVGAGIAAQLPDRLTSVCGNLGAGSPAQRACARTILPQVSSDVRQASKTLPVSAEVTELMADRINSALNASLGPNDDPRKVAEQLAPELFSPARPGAQASSLGPRKAAVGRVSRGKKRANQAIGGWPPPPGFCAGIVSTVPQYQGNSRPTAIGQTACAPSVAASAVGNATTLNRFSGSWYQDARRAVVYPTGNSFNPVQSNNQCGNYYAVLFARFAPAPGWSFPAGDVATDVSTVTYYC